MMQRTTLSEIARLSGVSRQVVSSILFPQDSNSIRYSESTREKVLQIAKQTNFRRNRTAMNLVRNCHGNIGILLRDYGMIWNNVINDILTEAHRIGKVLMLDYIPDNPDKLPVIVEQDAVDGIVIFEELSECLQKEIIRLGIPCVRVNTNIRTAPGCITFDELDSMKKIIEFLTKKNRRHLALFTTDSTHYSQGFRRKGFIQSVHKYKLPEPTQCIIEENIGKYNNDDMIISMMVNTFEQNRMIDAVILSQDRLAPMFYRAMKKLSISVPEEVAVVGYNNSVVSYSVDPELTAVYVDPREIGKTVIDIFDSMLNGKMESIKPVKIKYKIYERESTRVFYNKP